MSESSRIIRKFERFLSGQNGYYNNCTEVRPDGGAILSDRERSKEAAKNYQNPLEFGNVGKLLGVHIYNHKKKTEKFFRYKSRGKK